METATGPRAGVEWADDGDDLERGGRGWPIPHPNEPCDGNNPLTGRACLNGYHHGFHRDVSGAEWLDD